MDIFTLKTIRDEKTAITKYPIVMKNNSFSVEALDDPKIIVGNNVSNHIELFYDLSNLTAGLRLKIKGEIVNIALWNITTGSGGISADDIFVNTITSASTGKIIMESDTIFKGDVKITDVPGQDLITMPNCFHVQSNGNGCMWLQTDVDDGPSSDRPLFHMTKNGGNYGFSMGTSAQALPTTIFIAGNTTANTNGFFSFSTAQLTNNGNSVPTYSGISRLMQLSDVSMILERDLDMRNNDIVSVDNLTSSTITTPTYNITSSADQKALYSITGRAILANTDTVLIDWFDDKTTSRIGFDQDFGIFEPAEGLYNITFNNNITTTTGNIEMGWRIVDDLGNTVWVSVVQSSDLYEAETGFEGSQYETLTAYFDGIRTYTFHAKLNAAETCNFTLSLSRIM